MKHNEENTTLAGKLEFDLPRWFIEWEASLPSRLDTDADAMRAAIEVSAMNIKEKCGGPFGAVAVDSITRKVVAAGVNLVLSAKSSVLHAEIVCIMRAQKAVGSHTLIPAEVTLYSSSEPCSMCMGAIPWSGISRIVCAARDKDVRAAGYDEGKKPANWPASYAERGIEVTLDFMREDAVAVLERYAAECGVVY